MFLTGMAVMVVKVAVSLRQKGGVVWAQNEIPVVYGMPQAVVNAGLQTKSYL